MSPTNRKCGRAAGTLNCEYLTFLCIILTYLISHRASYTYPYVYINHLSHHVSTISSPVTCYLRHAAVATAAPAQLSPRHRTPPAEGNTAAAGGGGGGGAGRGRGAEGVLSIHMCGGSCHHPCNCSTATDQRLPEWGDPQPGCDITAYGAWQMGHFFSLTSCMTA